MNEIKWIENSFYIATILGAVLSLFISFNSISLLNIAQESKTLVRRVKILNTFYSRYPSFFVPFWSILLSLLIFVMIHILLQGSSLISFWFNLFIQIVLAGQFFSLKEKMLPLIKAEQIFLKQGTYAGLENLHRPLFLLPEIANPAQNYDRTIKALIDSLVKYTLLPLLILYFGGWAFGFLYLAWCISFEIFHLKNFLFHRLYLLPYNLWISILRILLHFCRAEKSIKIDFKEKYLSYRQIFVKRNKHSDSVYQIELLKEEIATDTLDDSERNCQVRLNTEKRETPESVFLNLDYLPVLQVLYLTSIDIQFIIFLIFIYLRTIY